MIVTCIAGLLSATVSAERDDGLTIVRTIARQCSVAKLDMTPSGSALTSSYLAPATVLTFLALPQRKQNEALTLFSKRNEMNYVNEALVVALRNLKNRPVTVVKASPINGIEVRFFFF